MKYILGTKIGMVQLYETSGHVIPSTVIHCEPNVVLEIKTPEKHGHNAIKVGYKTTKENKNNQAHNGIFKKVNVPARKIIRTFTNPTGTFKIGDLIGVSQFTPGEYVDVQGVTRGRGFTGAIQRWNFKIGPLSHGAGYPHRYQGSIAMGRGGSQAQRVAKGKKMHGHYGHETVTMQNLNVVLVNNDENLLIVSGAIPGPKGETVLIKSSYKRPNEKIKVDLITKVSQQKILQENEKLEDKEQLHAANVEAEHQEQVTENQPEVKKEEQK